MMPRFFDVGEVIRLVIGGACIGMAGSAAALAGRRF
jgi:hypothetical protein